MIRCCAFLYACVLTTAVAQIDKPLSSGELELALKKSVVVGSVLYIAAHPDDENTAFLAYTSNDRLLRTAYLSMTRGDGGQNLIGSEQSAELGIIRTQELVGARRIDGAEQFFTRAIDFGYSKSPDETLSIWNHDEILSDVVRVIRSFRPDVIVTRFPSTGEGGHGQHTASAILAEEAFAAAGDPSRFPEQLETLTPWRPTRLVWNAWPSVMKQKGLETSSALQINVGGYSPLLGKSFAELAADSRTMHKSQGFGVSGIRGEFVQYFVPIAGDTARGDLFSGINTSWKRLAGSNDVDSLLHLALHLYDPAEPHLILPILTKAYKALDHIVDERWRTIKRKELEEVIRSCAGLWLEAITDDFGATPGDSLAVNMGIVVRTPATVILKQVQLANLTINYGEQLEFNRYAEKPVQMMVPELPVSQPYWLRQPPSGGRYSVEDASMVGLATSPPVLTARVMLNIAGEDIVFDVPAQYRWTDPVQGERFRPFVIIPSVSINLDESVFIYADANPKQVLVHVKAGKNDVRGSVRLKLPPGWTTDPVSATFTIQSKYDETTIPFSVRPMDGALSGTLTAVADAGGASFDRSWHVIEYDHFPKQSLFPPASAKLLRLDVKRKRSSIGYIMGAGDNVPRYLTEIGYRVTLIPESNLEETDFSKFDAILTGVRAFNTLPRLKFAVDRLMEYVRMGGTLVVQYNTSHSLVTQDLAPYPITLSHDRVTDENAVVRLLDPDNSLLSTPNRITSSDFDGWIQERGLYFLNKWDSRFRPLLGMADKGETETQGSLLFTRYGKGVYIYTGLSFFRQLPAGVPGAYRLLVNLIEAR